jgi:hypothetical protein
VPFSWCNRFVSVSDASRVISERFDASGSHVPSPAVGDSTLRRAECGDCVKPERLFFRSEIGLSVFGRFAAVTDHVDLLYHLDPCLIERAECFAAFLGQRVIFAGRPLRRFFPAVGKQTGVFLAGEDRIERAFDHDHLGRFQLGDDPWGVESPRERIARMQYSRMPFRIWAFTLSSAMALSFWDYLRVLMLCGSSGTTSQRMM